MRVVTGIEQGTMEWHIERMKRVTATALEDVMGPESAQLALIAELIAEEATEQAKITRPTAEMERGNAEEGFAIKEFERQYGKKIDKATICIHDEWDWLAWSPDGLIKVGKKYKEAVEVKNPDSKTGMLYRIYNMVAGVKIPKSKEPFLGVPADYKWQCVDAFIVNEDLEKLYFLVYDSRIINPENRLYVVVLTRDMPELQDAIAEAKERLVEFRSRWLEIRDKILPNNF